MSYDYNFSDVNESDLGLMRPGVIYALDRYPSNHFKAGKLDSEAENKRIGRILGALDSAGLTEWSKKTGNSYTYFINASLDPKEDERSLNLALGESEERFDKAISKSLSREGRNENTVVEEILTNDFRTHTQRDIEKLSILRSYSVDTVKFLDDVYIIKSLDEPELVADKEDLDYLKSNIHLLL